MKKRFFAAFLIAVITFSSTHAFCDITSEEAEPISGTLEITVSGDKVDSGKLQKTICFFDDGGSIMVPLRAVSEKMGFTVDWNGEENSVEIYNDTLKVKIKIDDDLYEVIRGTDFETVRSYGAAPRLIDSTTYVPAMMFELLGYKYTSSGLLVEFNVLDEPVDGGWSRSESIAVTEKVISLVDKATDGLTTEKYTPLAYLSSQIVAGKNHCVLCKVTPLSADAHSGYAIVYFYEDPEGNAHITGVLDSTMMINLTEMPGGWYEALSTSIPDELKASFNEAADKIDGAKLTPLMILAEQVVGGMNYCFLSEISYAEPYAVTRFALVYVFVDLKGNAEITDISDFK